MKKSKEIPILYEDDYLLIVNKPPNLLVVPAPFYKTTLTDILNKEYKPKTADYKFYPCHRLDKETSGVLVYAKDKVIQRKVMNEFKNRRVKKTYIAFIQGILRKERGKIDFELDSKKALTLYRVLERRKNFTIVEVNPITGRKNQIRRHFKMIGHPLVGESKFCFRKDFDLKFKRVCLHAKSIEFKHSLTHKLLYVDSELPLDLKRFLELNG